MIFYCDLQGNLKAFQNETVYQGSNNVTTIYVVAPFSRPVGLNISFTKPNKLVTSPAIMKWVGTLGNVKIPVSFVNIPEQFTDTYNVWAYALPYSITEQNGVVGVSVNAVIADSVDASGQQAYKGNLTTFTGQFTVAYSALPSPPTDIPTEWTQDKVLDLLNNYYNDAIQKIGEMNTLKTNAKDTLVKAINEVFDEIATTNATIGDLSTLTTDEKTTIVGAINEVDAHSDANKTEIGDLSALTTDEKATLVGAINEVDNHADNATTLANNAVATANGAVATANEAKTTAQTAETNANSAVDKATEAQRKAQEAITKAENNVYAVGFMTLQEAITAVNGYDNTVLKTNDNILVVAQGSPDLYVTSVEATNIPYNFTTVDKFNDDLVKNTVLQIGYYKVAFYETDGQPVTVAYQNVAVKSTDWVASTEFADFPYEAKIPLSNFVDYKTVPQVVFDIADTMSGNYAPICKSGDKCVYIYGKVQNEITLKTVITFAPNVNGASVVGGGYNNRGKWVASTTYAIDDLVYTDNGQFVCIEGITSTTSPEQDTQHWQATFVATGKTKNGLKFSGQDNGTGVQKTFDGSTAVEVAFDETTMTAKEVNGVLKVGAKGTVPEALPQEASALKSGNLPKSGWTDGDYVTYWTGTVSAYGWENYKILFQNSSIYSDVVNDIKLVATRGSSTARLYNHGIKQIGAGTTSNPRITGYVFTSSSSYSRDNAKIIVTEDGSVYGTGSYSAGSSNSETWRMVGKYETKSKLYTIPDTSITANSDILMELTDEGGVKAYSMEVGKMTVIRDTVPTQPIPYTYKVKQTNASGQFTLVNHYVPSIPENPTSLPVTYKKASGELPTTGWTTLDEGWKENTLPGQYWGAVTYGNGKFVAVKGQSTGAYSTGGISWTEMTMPAAVGWQSVTYGDGKFVAVAYNTTTGAYSTDGISWTAMILPASSSWQVTYGDGKFVAVGGGSDKGAYSTDGVSWTEFTLPANRSWHGVTYGNGKFVAVAYSSNKGAYSTDGINWTEFTLPATVDWNVTYGDGKFVAVARNTKTGAYSTDGISWATITLPASSNWFSVTYGNGKYVAVAESNDKGAYSTDCINWTSMSMPASSRWYGVTYGDGKFVAVAYNSANGAYWKAAADVTYTISDTFITANTSVKMYLTDAGGVKAYSKANGSIQVIRDTVPTTAIPYEYEVEQTSAEGLFEVINAYVPDVPTKTSELTNDSGFITAADIPSAGAWSDIVESATLTEDGLYEFDAVKDNKHYTSLIEIATGISTVGASAYLPVRLSAKKLTSDTVLFQNTAGTITVTHINTEIDLEAASITETRTNISFKYRKIN